MSITITGGKWRGRKISSIPGKEIRPTSGKVRQALFNIIGTKVSDADFLDLFAGTGAVGFEAFSRGAKSVCMVEKSMKAFRVLKKNTENLIFPSHGLELKYMDALSFVEVKKREKMSYDIIFSDPPFFQDFSPLWPMMRPLLRKSGCGIIQFPIKSPPNWADSADVVKKYGESGLAFFYI